MKPLMVLAVVGLIARTALAEPAPPTHRISVEQDPLAYLFDGWDAMLAYQHAALPHARATVSVFQVSLPQLQDGLHDAQSAVSLLLQYFVRDAGRGWMVGTQLSLVERVFTHDMADGSDEIDAFAVGAIVGYRWLPFGHGFFIYPWARLGVTIPVRGDRHLVIGDQRPTASWFDPVLTFHVGYELAF